MGTFLIYYKNRKLYYNSQIKKEENSPFSKLYWILPINCFQKVYFINQYILINFNFFFALLKLFSFIIFFFPVKLLSFLVGNFDSMFCSIKSPSPPILHYLFRLIIRFFKKEKIKSKWEHVCRWEYLYSHIYSQDVRTHGPVDK